MGAASGGSCTGGAIGGAVGEMTAELLRDELVESLNNDDITLEQALDWDSRGVDLAKLAGGLAALTLGEDVESAVSTAENAAKNNALVISLVVATAFALDGLDKLMLANDMVELADAVENNDVEKIEELATQVAVGAAIESVTGAIPATYLLIKLAFKLRKYGLDKSADAIENAVRKLGDDVAGGSGADTNLPNNKNNLDEAFHYTDAQWVDSINTTGLRKGSYATPDGNLSPLQAHIDLALPPNRNLPNAKLRIDLDGLRRDGFEVPQPTRVSNTVTSGDGRVYTQPGGGYEINFDYKIPPKYISIVE